MSKTRRKKKNPHIVGKIMAIIQIILSVIFVGMIMMVNILPTKYLIPIIAILVFLALFAFVSQFTRSAHIIGKIDCIIMCILLIVGNIYMFKASSTLLNITKRNDYVIDRIAVAVKAEDPAASIQEAADHTFGVQAGADMTKMYDAIGQIEAEVGQELYTEEYADVYSMVQALYDGDINAIIYNTAYDGSIIEQFPNFATDVKELSNVEVRTDKQVIEGDKKDVTKNPFTVFISGIDTEGSIDTTSRSDVNMLVTVNPVTKQIIMTSVPRDYYVQIPGVSGGAYDKLTHAGLYGPQASMDTLSELFGIDIDYYAKVNFTTLRDMVNALGGVDLNSRYDFTTISGEHFNEGMNYGVDGNAALAFARERYNLPNGDNDRVIDQQIVLSAIINKCTSPAILTGYMGIMDSLSDYFETSMSQEQIASLVKMQLDDGAKWNIISSAVIGTGDENTCYSAGDQMLYVMNPNYNVVNKAAEYIQAVKDGEILDQETVTKGLTEAAGGQQAGSAPSQEQSTPAQEPAHAEEYSDDNYEEDYYEDDYYEDYGDDGFYEDGGEEYYE